MLSITPIRSNGNYYLDLAAGSYYSSGGEPPGRWIGAGARALSLPDRVGSEALRNTLRGFSASDAKAKLVQNAGNSGRQRGHDATFTAPKSVSVLWAISPPWMRKDIQAAQQEATETALEYLEENAAFTRRGSKGQKLEKAKLVVAAFEHCSSRAQDPHLHTHCLIQNVCVRGDGTTGTLFGEVQRDVKGRVISTHNPLYRHQKAAGAIYRTELAAKLKAKLGLELVPAKNNFSFDVKGIPESALLFYSKRRQVIEDRIRELGLDSPEAAERVTLATREKKVEIHRPSLFARWSEEAKKWGLNEREASALCFQEGLEPSSSNVESALREQVESLASERAHFTKKDLVERLANALAPAGTRSAVITRAVESEIQSGEVVSLRWEEGDRAFHDPILTTQETLQMEWSFIQTVARSRHRTSEHFVGRSIVENIISERRDRGAFPLGEDQEKALFKLTCGGESSADQKAGAIRVLAGDPGTGKTTLLREAKYAWERAGYRVLGASLAGRAADVLEAETGIPSCTLKRWELAFSSRKHRDPAFQLDKRSVLVIDEAAMADTPLLSSVVCKAEESGALIVLVGDDKQCQAIGHGGAFAMAQRILGSADLVTNRRQRQACDRVAVSHLIAGDGEKALRTLVENNRITVEANEEKVLERLVSDWSTVGVEKPAENVIFVATNAERLKINQECQNRRLQFAQKMLRAFTLNDEGERIYSGDRIQFRETLSVAQPQTTLGDVAKDALLKTWNLKNPKHFETVRRGAVGTVLSINPLNDSLRVRLDDGRVIQVPMNVERPVDPSRPTGRRKKGRAAISLGYAQTTHAGQGATYENVYCLANTPSMQTRELSLVQLSRARNVTRVYTTSSLAGPEVTILSDIQTARESGDEKEILRLEEELASTRRCREDLAEASPLARGFLKDRRKVFASHEISTTFIDR